MIINSLESCIIITNVMHIIMNDRNQGALIGGDSIEEAFASLAAAVSACEQLLTLAPMGLDNVYVLSPEEMAAVREEQKQQSKDHEPAIPADEDKVGCLAPSLIFYSIGSSSAPHSLLTCYDDHKYNVICFVLSHLG